MWDEGGGLVGEGVGGLPVVGVGGWSRAGHWSLHYLSLH